MKMLRYCRTEKNEKCKKKQLKERSWANTVSDKRANSDEANIGRGRLPLSGNGNVKILPYREKWEIQEKERSWANTICVNRANGDDWRGQYCQRHSEAKVLTKFIMRTQAYKPL